MLAKRLAPLPAENVAFSLGNQAHRDSPLLSLFPLDQVDFSPHAHTRSPIHTHSSTSQHLHNTTHNTQECEEDPAAHQHACSAKQQDQGEGEGVAALHSALARLQSHTRLSVGFPTEVSLVLEREGSLPGHLTDPGLMC